MHISTRNPAGAPRPVPAYSDGNVDSRATLAVLEEMLGRSIQLRDLYKSARWQAADPQYGRLRQLFDCHYKQQLQLVDALVDRIRMMGGTRHLFASNFLQGPQLACPLRGNKAAKRLLSDLLDAHELLLNSGRPNGPMDEQWALEVPIGQVMQINDVQSSAIADELVFDDSRRTDPIKAPPVTHAFMDDVGPSFTSESAYPV